MVVSAVACLEHLHPVRSQRLEELIDIAKELERLAGEKEKLEGEIKRGEGKLSNAQFVNNAPEKVVNSEREKLAKYKEMYNGVVERIKTLSGN